MAKVTSLQGFLDAIAEDWGISPKFRQTSDHPYTCKCAGCADWWRKTSVQGGSWIGPDEDGLYGPFTKEELELDND